MVAIEGSMPIARVSSGQSDLHGLTLTGGDDTYKNTWRVSQVQWSVSTFKNNGAIAYLYLAR